MSKFLIAMRIGLWFVLFGMAQGPLFAARVEAASTENITMTAAVGLDTTARIGYWVPVQVTMVNNGADFSGKLSLRTFSGTPRAAAAGVIVSSQRFEQMVTVPRGTQQVVTIAVPFNVGSFNPRGVRVELLDRVGKMVALQWQRTYALNAGDVLVGVLSDQHTGLGPLNAAQFPSSANSLITASLDATTLPESATLLNNLDALIIENFATKTLDAAQMAAIQTWVNQGGALIEIGGATGQRTLAGFPAALLPVQVQGVESLPAGTHLLPDEQPAIPDTLPSPVVISTGQVQAGGTGIKGTQTIPLEPITVLAHDTTPLFVQQQVGRGSVSYLAFDPMADPLLSWSGTSVLWSHVLLRALGDQLLISGTAPHYTSGPGQLLARGGLFAMIQPAIGFSFFTLILLFLGYVLMLGPLTVLLIRRFKKPFWLWRIMLSVIVVFSLLAYGLAFYQRGASLLNNSISLIQLDQNGTAAHITTYMGMYTPDQGNYQIHIPSSEQPGLAQALANAQWFSDVNGTYGDPNANVNYDNHQTTVDINGVGQWTFHTLVMEQNRQLQGSLVTHMTLHDKQLVGSITNTLPTGVSDVALLMPHSFMVIGHLNAGETKQIAAPITDFSAVGNTTQANQLTLYNHLPANYFPYMQNQQPQTTTQRHMALLQALSGAGYNFVPCNGPCALSTVINKQSIVTPVGNVAAFHPNNGSDPLLLAGVPATLLAWTDQPVDGSNDITMNTVRPHGLHDNLLQVPAMLALDASSTHIVPDTIAGHVVSTQGGNVVYALPNVYSLGGGSGITFEFTLTSAVDAVQALHAVQFVVASANATPQTAQTPGKSAKLNVSLMLQAQLYNWQTKTWERLSVNNGRIALSQAQPYVGPNGRVLLQVNNQDAASSLLLVSKPALVW